MRAPVERSRITLTKGGHPEFETNDITGEEEPRLHLGTLIPCSSWRGGRYAVYDCGAGANNFFRAPNSNVTKREGVKGNVFLPRYTGYAPSRNMKFSWAVKVLRLYYFQYRSWRR